MDLPHNILLYLLLLVAVGAGFLLGRRERKGGRTQEAVIKDYYQGLNFLLGDKPELGVDRFIEAVGRALADGNHIEIRGFGSFKVKSRRARIARNPRTGATVQVPEKVVPYFKVSKELKRIIEEANPVIQTRESGAAAQKPAVPAPDSP